MMADQSSLIVDVRPGESVSLLSGVEVRIELIKKSGQLARLRITAPPEVKIDKTACQIGEDVASMA